MLRKDAVLKKIIDGGKIAEKEKVKILGLGGFTSIFSNQGLDVKTKLNVPITTGNTYTASLVIEGILKATGVLSYNLSNSTLVIIGATGDIGSICAKFFAPRVKRLVLIARDQKKMSQFRLSLENEFGSKIVVSEYPNDLIKNAEIVITSTSSITTLIDPKTLKTGAVVCDVSMPPNVTRQLGKERTDILAFEGGHAQFPFFEEIKDTKFLKGFPHGSIFGCLAETIILALENNSIDLSLGRGNITEDKMDQINRAGKKHGFVLAPFFCGSKKYSAEDIERIKKLKK